MSVAFAPSDTRPILPEMQEILSSATRADARDPFADDTGWLHRRLREDGVEAELLAWPGLAHRFLPYARAQAPARNAFAAAARFLGRMPSRGPA